MKSAGRWKRVFDPRRILFRPDVLSVIAALIPILLLSKVGGDILVEREELVLQTRLYMEARRAAEDVDRGLQQWTDLVRALSQAEALGVQDPENLGPAFENLRAAASGIIGITLLTPDRKVIYSQMGLAPGSSVESMFEQFPVMEAAYVHSLSAPRGEVFYSWQYEKTYDPKSRTVGAWISVKDASGEKVAAVLVVALDLRAIFDGQIEQELPSDNVVRNFLMVGPGVMMIGDEQSDRMMSAIQEAGLAERLWEAGPEMTRVRLPEGRYLVRGHHSDLTDRGMGRIQFVILSAINEAVFTASVRESLFGLWPALLGSAVVLVVLVLLQQLRTRISLAPLQEGSRRFAEGRYDAKIPHFGWDRRLDSVVDALNAMADDVADNINRMQVLLEVFPLPVLLEAQGRVRYLNPSFLKHFACSREAVGGDGALRQLLAKSGFPDEAIDVVEALLPGEQAVVRVSCQTGEQRTFNVEAGLVPQTRLIMKKRIFAFWDTTAQVEMGRMRSELVATAAHELRTPLSLIRGYAELLAHGRVYSDELKGELHQVILERSLFLERMVADMLDIDRISSGRPLRLAPMEFDLAGELRKRLKTFPGLYPEHTVECRLPEHAIPVFHDLDRVIQVLANLMSNAAKFSQPGTAIRMRLEATDDEFRTIVADEGIGMTAAQVSRVFEKFYRVDASSKAPQGSGIGLALVESIVTACGGRIEVESELGKGTVFTVIWPRRLEPSSD